MVSELEFCWVLGVRLQRSLLAPLVEPLMLSWTLGKCAL
jgi:hypothetical protein